MHFVDLIKNVEGNAWQALRICTLKAGLLQTSEKPVMKRGSFIQKNLSFLNVHTLAAMKLRKQGK
ncbi:MAG: hypothetical protein RBR49_06900 [Desulfovibrio desulfuricans]|nr:hypothetical protein [Desulfovibrio desulfuricans]